ncbi:MAG: AMP-binding protein [Candidatus Binatia bacterium]
MDSNLYTLLRSRWAHAMDRPALVDVVGFGPTWRELDDLAARFASTLVSRGVSSGDRVVVQVEKSVGAVALYLACLRTGAVFVPLNTAYTEAEVDRFLRDAEPRVFVCSRHRTAAAPHVEVLGTTADSSLWAEALVSPPHEPVTARAPKDLAAIVYTSGTTGVSKGAMLNHGNLAANALTLNALWDFRDDDVLLHALPIYHVHGLFIAMHCAMLSAATMIFLPKFDAAEVRTLLRRSTVMMGVPTFYTRLLGLDGLGREDCGRMRLFISGSAPLLAGTWREFEARTGHAILERYGMTETGMITSNPLGGERVPGTVGFALPDVEIRIVREDDEHSFPADAGEHALSGKVGLHAKPGEAGILEVRGPNVFAGYWKLPAMNAVEFRPDGFFVTGDIAVADEHGRVTLVGRAKDLIISGGLNIYPKEIEDVLDAVDGVAESAVVGIPDSDFGEAVVAIVVRSPESRVTAEALMDTVRARLARFKHPRRIVFVDELPRNAMGKVQKNVLRENQRTEG